jgi:predicted MFS family arabinose efflux permease
LGHLTSGVKPAPSTTLVALLAVGAGLAVAGIYYNQPMLGALAGSLHATPASIGFIPTATQLGYGGGILLLAPLGDRLDRRKVVLVKSALLAVALAAAGFVDSVPALAVTSLAIGLLATVAQDLVPAAAAVADPASRGRTVGTVMTGLLLGILLSRVVSGAVTLYASWRAVFLGASVSVALFAVVAARVLPPFPATTRDSYPALLGSMAGLVRDVAPLRRAALTQGLLCIAFSGFWSTLALGLAAPPFGLSSFVAGSFGIAGAAGALAAPIAGGVSDRHGPRAVIRVGAALTAAAFIAMALFGRSLGVLIAGTVLFDLGVQSSLIAHQTIVYAQDPGSRSRLNAIFVSAMFLGMSTGAFVASRVFARAGLTGVCVMSALAASGALALRLLPDRTETHPAR